MSKPEKKLFDIAKLFRSARYKTQRFIDQKILAGSKAMLLVGGDSNPHFRNSFVSKCKSSWKIAGLSIQPFQCDMHIPLQGRDRPHLQHIQQRIAGFHKLYESIVLMPDTRKNYKSIAEEDFLENIYPQQEPNKLELALLSFRIASRFLTTNGVVILSSSAASFFEEKALPSSLQCLNDQTSCINLHIGERDHTDIDSQSFSVLCEQMNLQQAGKEQEAVLELYKNWVEGRGLPFPGSFAKLLRKQDVIYPEFY